MKKLIVLLLLSYSTLNGQASIVFAGETVYQNDYSISYSLGQIFYQSYENSSDAMVVNEGVQQPYEIITENLEDEKPTEFNHKIIESLTNNIGKLKHNFSVYPNPTVQFVTLNLEKFEIQNSYSYTIHDAHGKLVALKKINDASNKIDVSYLNDGLFFLTVSQDNKSVTTFKILKLNN